MLRIFDKVFKRGMKCEFRLKGTSERFWRKDFYEDRYLWNYIEKCKKDSRVISIDLQSFYVDKSFKEKVGRRNEINAR